MRPIVVVPFASAIHGKEYYLHVFEIFKKYFAKYDVVLHPEVVTDREKAEELGKKYCDHIPVALALTGGTSKLITSFAAAGDYDRMVIVAHSEHNSLPSAISARARLELQGLWTWVFHCHDIASKECELVVDRAMRVLEPIAIMLSSRIGVIGVDRVEEQEELKARFDIEVVTISFDEVEELASNVDKKSVEQFVEEFEPLVVEGLRKDILEDVARLYLALKTLVQKRDLMGIAIDCFPFIEQRGYTPCLALAKLCSDGIPVACEADIRSLLLMNIARYLAGHVGWMLNAVTFNGRYGYFAHCTLPLSIAKRPRLVTHFETEKPYAVASDVENNVWTIASLSHDYSLLAVGVGRKIAGGLLYNSMCRSQIVLEFDYDVEGLPLVAPANHHVAMKGDVRRDLRIVAELLGIDYADYSELLEYSEV